MSNNNVASLSPEIDDLYKDHCQSANNLLSSELDLSILENRKSLLSTLQLVSRFGPVGLESFKEYDSYILSYIGSILELITMHFKELSIKFSHQEYNPYDGVVETLIRSQKLFVVLETLDDRERAALHASRFLNNCLWINFMNPTDEDLSNNIALLSHLLGVINKEYFLS